jgi:hypothetical protein
MTRGSDVRVCAIPQNRGLINQEHMTVDHAGREHQFYSAPLIDRMQLRTSDKLTVFAPTVNTDGVVYIDTVNYTLH